MRPLYDGSGNPTGNVMYPPLYVIAIQYAMSIILHKMRIENNKPLPTDKQPP